MAGEARGAVDKYIRVPLAYLRTPFYRDLAPRERDVFCVLLMYARMDKQSGPMRARVSLRTIGKELGMSAVQVGRHVEALVAAGAVVVLSDGAGKRHEYVLAKPVRVEVECNSSTCDDVTVPGGSVTGSNVNALQFGASGSDAVENTVENGGNDGGKLSKCNTFTREAVTQYTFPTGSNPQGYFPSRDRLTGSAGAGAPAAGRVPEKRRCDKPVFDANLGDYRPCGRVLGPHPDKPGWLYCPSCRRPYPPEPDYSEPRPMRGGQDRALGADW